MAVHEAGHVLALAATGRTLPERVEIGPGGGTVEAPRVRGERTLAALDDELVVLLAGRAAERLVLGGPSAGAGGGPTSDLGRATRLATLIESSFGLGEAGPLWIDPDVVSLAADPGLKASVQARLARAEAAADALVAENRAVLERVAQALFASRSLGRTELAGLIGRDAADDDLPDKAPAPA
jgi:ATP-dependent Zn protease